MIRNKKKQKSLGKKKSSSAFARMYGRLKALVEFLNLDIDHATQENISGELNLRIYYDLGPDGSRNQLRSLKMDLIEVLRPIAELPEGGGSERFKHSRQVEAAEKMNALLESLVERINQMKFTAQFRVYPGVREVPLNSAGLFNLHVEAQKFPADKPKAHLWGTVVKNPVRRLLNFEQGIFSWGEGKWMVKMLFNAIQGYNPERDFYGDIAEGLMTGELARLRQCAYCKTFFVAQQPRVSFCPGHARKYHDSRKSMAGHTPGQN